MEGRGGIPPDDFFARSGIYCQETCPDLPRRRRVMSLRAMLAQRERTARERHEALCSKRGRVNGRGNLKGKVSDMRLEGSF